jgi:hypothetical protein
MFLSFFFFSVGFELRASHVLCISYHLSYAHSRCFLLLFCFFRFIH